MFDGSFSRSLVGMYRTVVLQKGQLIEPLGALSWARQEPHARCLQDIRLTLTSGSELQTLHLIKVAKGLGLFGVAILILGLDL